MWTARGWSVGGGQSLVSPTGLTLTNIAQRQGLIMHRSNVVPSCTTSQTNKVSPSKNHNKTFISLKQNTRREATSHLQFENQYNLMV